MRGIIHRRANVQVVVCQSNSKWVGWEKYEIQDFDVADGDWARLLKKTDKSVFK